MSANKSHIIYNVRALSFKVRSGDEYEFLYDMATRAGHIHPKGSIIRVHDATTQTPYNESWNCERR